jgi:tetratricopeptide (TPR) repeat protein
LGYFLWDDQAFLFDSLIVSQNLIDVFFQNHYGLYHPVTSVWVKITYFIFKNSAFELHIISVLFHLINSLLVYKLTKLFKISNLAAIFGMAIFLFHPLNLEPVLWLTSIKDLILGLFTLLSIIAYINYNNKGNIRLFWISMLYFVLAVLSKPQAIVLPFVFFILDIYFNKPINKRTLGAKFLMLILSGTLLLANLYIRSHNYDTSFSADYSKMQDIYLILSAFALYISEIVLPINLSIFYPISSFLDFNNLAIWFPFITFLIIAVILYKKKRNDLFLLVIIVCIFLLPVIRIIPIGESLINNRYTYSSIIFFAILISRSIELSITDNRNYLKFIFYSISFVLILSNFIYYQDRLRDWDQSNIRLFQSDMEKFPNSEILSNTLGSLYYKNKMYDPAKVYFERAIIIDPSYFKAYFNLGVLYEKEENYALAIENYQKALTISPNFALPVTNLVPVLYAKNEFHGVIFYFEKYKNYLADFPEILNQVGKAYYALGNIENSIKCYETALVKAPKNAEYLYNLAVSWGKIGNFVKSIDYLDRAIQIDPTFDKAYILRGLSKVYQNTNGCGDFHKAAKLGNMDGRLLFEKFCL